MIKFVKILIFLLPFGSFAQAKTLDSLKLALKTTKHDTTRCTILNAMIETESDDAVWPKYNEQLKNIAEYNLKNTLPNTPLYNVFLRHLAQAFNNIGYILNEKGELLKALEYYNKSLKIQDNIHDKIGLATSLNNIGYIYNTQGNIAKALDCYDKSLRAQEVVGNKKGIANSLNNIGLVYKSQQELKKALEYYTKSLKTYKEIGGKNEIAISLNNIGQIYSEQGNILKALECFNESIKIDEEIGNKNQIAISLNNIGDIYAANGSKPKAFEYFTKSLKLFEEVGNKNGIAYSLNGIGSIYFYQKKNNEALTYCNKSINLSKEIGLADRIKSAAHNLMKIYKAKGDYKNALLNYELYIQMRDSISNQETKKASIKSQLKYEYEKKAAADSVKVGEEKKLTTVKLKQEKTQRYFLYGGLSLTILFGLFMFNRFRITQKQKNIIDEQKTIVENQKHLVEEKQKEVLDSIRYAKRIQQSLLPTEKYIERILRKGSQH